VRWLNPRYVLRRLQDRFQKPRMGLTEEVLCDSMWDIFA
jgi:hypothetical protein